jgi:UDP-N-acetylmuramate--alanine ligase
MVVLTDVYPAGEPPIPGVSGRVVLHAVLDHHPALPVAYLPTREDLVAVPARYARPGDVVLTLGAGDLTAMPDVWLATARDARRERAT